MEYKIKYYIFKDCEDSSVICYESLAEVLDYYFKNKFTIFVVIVLGDKSYLCWLHCENNEVDLRDIELFCSFLRDVQNGCL